jgi:hypothetical protein
MRIRRKLILGLCIAFLIIAASFCSIIIYYYTHPPAVRSLLEKSISRTAKVSVTIGTLAYSLKPLRFQAGGVVLEPLDGGGGLHLEIPTLTAEMALEGPFGDRSLVVKSLRIGDFSLHVSEYKHLPRFSRTVGKPSVLSWLMQKLIGVIFFKDIRFEAVGVAGGKITAELKEQIIKLNNLQATLDTERRIEIACSADIKWPVHKMHFSAPDLQITADRVISVTDPEIPLHLSITKAVFQNLQARVSGMEIKARLNYRHNSRELFFGPLDLAVEKVSLRQQSGSEFVPINLHLNTTGRWDLKENELHAFDFQLTMSDMANLRGTFQAYLAPQTRIALELRDSDFFAEKLLRLLPGKMQQKLRFLTWSGAVGLQGEINGLKKENQWRWHCDLQGRLADNFLTYRMNEMKLSTKIRGHIGAVGTFPLLSVSVSMETAETSFSAESIEMKPFKARLSLSGEYPVFLIEELTAVIPRVHMTAGKRHIPIDEIQVSARRGRLLMEKKALFLPEISFTSSLVKNLLLSLKAKGKHLDIGIQGEQINLIGSAEALNLLPAGWQVGGLDTIQMHALRKDQGDVSFTCTLGLREVQFQNKDGSSLGENIAINAAIDGRYRLATSSLTATGSLEVHGGEILLGRFYGDLKRNAFFSSAEARYDTPRRSLELTSLSIGLKDILALNINGSLSHREQTRHVHLDLNIPWTPLRPLFQQFLVETFKTTNPALVTLDTRGAVSANIDLTGTDNHWQAAGHVRWKDGGFSSNDQSSSLEGIDLDLPIWYQSAAGGGSKKPLEGALSIKSMVLPLVEEQSLALNLEAEPNHLFVKSPTTLSVPGGQVHIGPLFGRDIFSSRPTIETSLAMDGLDLKPLLGRIWSQSPEGTITAKLDPVILKGDSIESQGELRLKAFNGEIILSQLGMSGLFTPAPLVRFNAQLKDLNLGALTTGTSFGKIDGLLRGHINDLEIANGQPQKFDLLLETIKNRKISQRISVRAVDNIAQIGGAQSPFVGFAKIFTSFFKQFPYRKIGVHASLKNDIFRINGTIKESGKEYLVRRGALWGVDVINQSTDNRTSFRDMAKRIKRVGKGSGGPVVK